MTTIGDMQRAELRAAIDAAEAKGLLVLEVDGTTLELVPEWSLGPRTMEDRGSVKITISDAYRPSEVIAKLPDFRR